MFRRIVALLTHPTDQVPAATPDVLAPPRQRLERRRRERGGADIIRAYLQRHDVRGLQLGTGSHPLEGWLNGDPAPASPDVLCIDVKKPLPFADETLHVIFSDHLFEHLTAADAAFHLQECFRTLRPEGRIRITSGESQSPGGALEAAGFEQMTECRVGMSDEPWLQNVEHEGRNRAPYTRRTIVLEALKPPRYRPA